MADYLKSIHQYCSLDVKKAKLTPEKPSRPLCSPIRTAEQKQFQSLDVSPVLERARPRLMLRPKDSVRSLLQP